LPEAGEGPIVWRRSMPHAGKWNFLPDMIEELQDKGWEIQAFVTTRDWLCQMQSRIDNGFSEPETVFEQNQKAYEIILNDLTNYNIPFYFISYEQLLEYKFLYINQILDFFDLPQLGEGSIEIKNGNQKYYNEVRFNSKK